ncbi:hypothetical protein [Paraburkholderia sacchari]|uniref:hypothetical protein n=1 Tax=Paraburkholderia sacchari TaxID=159450 RepID=UPI0039A40125
MLLTLSMSVPCAMTAPPALGLTVGGNTLSLTAQVSLARPDATEITVPNDVAYGKSMTYRAVPLAALGHRRPFTGNDSRTLKRPFCFRRPPLTRESMT